MSLVFKAASEPWEFDQIYGLIYKAFVEEIPQHDPNPEQRLIDPRLARSACFICLNDRRVVGVVALSGERPFSLDGKLPRLDSYLPPASRPCEIRRLTVEKAYRGSHVFLGLFKQAVQHSTAQGYDLAVISAAPRQEKLYRHLGFVPFGPRVGTEAAPYQPMYLTWDRLRDAAAHLIDAALPEAGNIA